jgi:hypothetical protein
VARQREIEKKLAARHLSPGGIAMSGLSSSWQDLVGVRRASRTRPAPAVEVAEFDEVLHPAHRRPVDDQLPPIIAATELEQVTGDVHVGAETNPPESARGISAGPRATPPRGRRGEPVPHPRSRYGNDA